MRYRLWTVSLLALALVARARAGVTPQIERAVRAATFEVVLQKPTRDPLSYEKPLPFDLIPYQQRTDEYQPVGTAFALGPGTYVTAAHVLEAAVDSQYGEPALRGEDGKAYPIASIVRFSADPDYVVFTLAGAPKTTALAVNRAPRLDEPVFAVGTIEEVVVLRIRIDKGGCVVAKTVAGSSGSDALGQAALRWIETASYLPAERHGYAVSFTGDQPVNFSLSN